MFNPEHDHDDHEGLGHGINPLALLHQCFSDLAETTQDFLDDDGDDARGYMKAVDGIKDSVDAVITAVFVSIIGRTQGVLPIELLAENFSPEELKELDELEPHEVSDSMRDTQRLLTQTVARAAAAGRL